MEVAEFIWAPSFASFVGDGLALDLIHPRDVPKSRRKKKKTSALHLNLIGA